jgi:hypothetical protein
MAAADAAWRGPQCVVARLTVGAHRGVVIVLRSQQIEFGTGAEFHIAPTRLYKWHARFLCL